MTVVAMIREMLEAGLSVEQALVAAEVFERSPTKSPAAIRQARYRHNKSSRVTVSDDSDARYALPSSGSSSPEPLSTPNQPTSPPIVPPSQDRRATPEIVLQSVLDPMSAKRWSGHCGRRYSEETAQAHANVLRDIRGRGGSASDAIDLAIRRGWKTIEIEWLVNAGLKLTSPPPQSAEVDWPSRIEVFRSSATWAHAWGPKPGEPGCKVPPELLQERAA